MLAEDFGYTAAPVPLPSADRHRLNKDLMHFTYDRLRHTPATKPWPDSILACLHDPVVGFMRHVEPQADLFPSAEGAQIWRELIDRMQSGRQLIIRCMRDDSCGLAYEVSLGCVLPSGKAALTKFGQPF